jgi:hypothetical protein
MLATGTMATSFELPVSLINRRPMKWLRRFWGSSGRILGILLKVIGPIGP